MLYRAAALPLLALALLAGCPAGAPEIVVTPASIDFGEVPVAEEASRLLTIENTGSSSAVVSFALTPDTPFAISLETALSIDAGDTRTLFVETSPTGTGLSVATLTLAWGDQLTEVGLSVTGTASDADEDQDGYTADVDCDDTDPDVNPGATEVCNGIDDDCEGGVDEDFDADGDDYTTCGDDGEPGTADDDCDDAEAAANPGATEVCDSIDNNCDAVVDEGFDVDKDTYTSCDGDCDDGNAAINPGASEECNGLDEDCDGDIDEDFDDLDGDGAATCTDCDDNDGEVFPGATEVCDSKDNDCNGSIDDGFPDADGDTFNTCSDCDDGNANAYPGAPQLCDASLDNDCDGTTDPEESDDDGDGATECDGDCDDADSALNPNDADNDGVSTCDATPDCDDADSSNFPGNTEQCDGVDNDCDGVPENSSDQDGDGVTVCAGDCDDLDAGINPSATEICDGADNDCDGTVDNGFTDGDGDGAADCVDCDDADPTAFPGNPEVCDAVDNDCDTTVDEGFDADLDTYFDTNDAGCAATYGTNADCNDGNDDVYPGAPDVCDPVLDNDCDGVTDPQESDDDSDGVSECDGDCDDGDGAVNPNDADSDGVSTCDGTPDCDDADGSNFPGNAESCDGADNDCDTVVDNGFDGDVDSFFDGSDAGCVSAYGAANVDCDDGAATVYPGAPDVCDAYFDNDCDGNDDPLESDDDSDGATECAGDCDDADAGLNINDDDMDGVTTCDLDPDCDDADGDVFPGATELCSGDDLDCDGVLPDACATCDAILDEDPTGRAGMDGVWRIDPDGVGGDPEFDAWCDMTTDGGGWTLIMRTTDNGTDNTNLITNYADFYSTNVGSAASGASRIAGQYWETLADNGDSNDEIMVMHGLVKSGGAGDCDLIPYIMSGSGFTLSVPALGSATYIYDGPDPNAVVNGNANSQGAKVALFSASDDGPQAASCVTAINAAPWFYASGNCGQSFPTVDSIWPSPLPTINVGRVDAADITLACDGIAPETSSFTAWYAQWTQEYYLR